MGHLTEQEIHPSSSSSSSSYASFPPAASPSAYFPPFPGAPMKGSFDEDEARWAWQQPAPAPPLSLHFEIDDAQCFSTLSERKAETNRRQLSTGSSVEWLTFIKGDVNNDDDGSMHADQRPLPKYQQQQPRASAYWGPSTSGDFVSTPTSTANHASQPFLSSFSTPTRPSFQLAPEVSPSLHSVASDSSLFTGDVEFSLYPSSASHAYEPSETATPTATMAPVPAPATPSGRAAAAGLAMAPARLKRKISMLQSMDFFQQDPLNFNADDKNMADLDADLSKHYLPFREDDEETVAVAAAANTDDWVPSFLSGGLDFDQVEMGDENLAALPYVPPTVRHASRAFSLQSAASLLPRVGHSDAAAAAAAAGRLGAGSATASSGNFESRPGLPSASGSAAASDPSFDLSEREALVLAQQYPVNRIPFASLENGGSLPYNSDDVVDLGTYTRAQRKQVLDRYHAKMASRKKVAKVVKYPGRKLFAEARPRVGGRFVKLPVGFHKKFKKENA